MLLILTTLADTGRGSIQIQGGCSLHGVPDGCPKSKFLWARAATGCPSCLEGPRHSGFGSLRSSVLVLIGAAPVMRKTTLLPSSSRVAVIAVCPAASSRGPGGQHHRLPSPVPFPASVRKHWLRLFGGLFRHGLLSLLFLLRGLFLGYGLLRLFRKRIGRRNFTHRGRCGLSAETAGSAAGAAVRAYPLPAGVSLIRAGCDISSGAALPQRPVSRGTRTPPLFPSNRPGRQLGKSGHILRKGPVTIWPSLGGSS